MNQATLPSKALGLVVKTAKETVGVAVTEGEQRGRGHQTAPMSTGDSRGGCLDEGAPSLALAHETHSLAGNVHSEPGTSCRARE